MEFKRSIASVVLLIAIVGVMAVDVISNRPVRWVADESTGRVCAAFHFFGRPAGRLVYYTTSVPCTASWSFTLIGGAAALFLLGSRR